MTLRYVRHHWSPFMSRDWSEFKLVHRTRGLQNFAPEHHGMCITDGIRPHRWDCVGEKRAQMEADPSDGGVLKGVKGGLVPLLEKIN